MRKPTQNERLLAYLKDGAWKSITDIHRETGVGRPNSRASELRKRGHTIVHEIRDGVHGYRLETAAHGTPAAGELPAAVSSWTFGKGAHPVSFDPGTGGDGVLLGTPAPSPNAQLALEFAA